MRRRGEYLLGALVGALALAMTGCATPTPLPLLAGTEWVPVDGTDSFVRFESGDVVMASAGCNMLRATYRQSGESLAMSRVLATKKLCPPEIMTREGELIAALEATLSAEIRDDGKLGLLVLRDADGAELMELRRSDWD